MEEFEYLNAEVLADNPEIRILLREWVFKSIKNF